MKSKVAPLIAPMRQGYIETMSKARLSTSHALLFHTHTSNNQLQLVTVHPVTTNPRGTPSIEAGHPVTPSDERLILDLLVGRVTSKKVLEIFPERLLYRDASRTVWWIPSDIRPMYLRDVASRTTITTRWPTLVLMAVDRVLFMVAVAEDIRPDASTPVHHCPMPNLWPSTQLCTGDAVLPKGSAISDIPQWEAVVLDTAWTHSNNPHAIRAHGKKVELVDAFWKKRNTNISPFPNSRLTPLGLTLGQWIVDPRLVSR